MKYKRDIDRAVAILLGEREADVSRTTGAFLNELRRLLIEEGAVTLSSLGRFLLREENFNMNPVRLTKGTFRDGERRGTQTVVVPSKHRVYFSKSATFRRLLKERRATTEKDNAPAERRRNGQVRRRRDG